MTSFLLPSSSFFRLTTRLRSPLVWSGAFRGSNGQFIRTDHTFGRRLFQSDSTGCSLRINSIRRLLHSESTSRGFSSTPLRFTPKMAKDHILTLTCPDKSGIVYAVGKRLVDSIVKPLTVHLSGHRITRKTSAHHSRLATILGSSLPEVLHASAFWIRG